MSTTEGYAAPFGAGRVPPHRGSPGGDNPAIFCDTSGVGLLKSLLPKCDREGVVWNSRADEDVKTSMKGLQVLLATLMAVAVSWGLVGGRQVKNPTPGLPLTETGPKRTDKVVHTDTEWRKLLTKTQYAILRGHGTEAAFCSPLLANHGDGTFSCAACGQPLFTTSAKFSSGTGWPSFFQPVTKDAVWYKLDTGFGMTRTEVCCARCDSHLGHVFDDGPVDKGGRRYCMNGEALNFKPTAH